MHIFTNENDADAILNIIKTVKQNRQLLVETHTPTYLGHPYLLTWSHFHTFRKLFESDQSITHFMYLEDDIFITPKNIEYWLKSRQDLKIAGLIPSFLRYEKKKDSAELYSTDALTNSNLDNIPTLKTTENYCYLNLQNPYQGMYLLDRDLMYEHLTSLSSIPGNSHWGIREQAAAGLTFINIPPGCNSRNFIGYDSKNSRIDPNSLIHHLPNNYADNSNTPFGKIKINELIIHAD